MVVAMVVVVVLPVVVVVVVVVCVRPNARRWRGVQSRRRMCKGGHSPGRETRADHHSPAAPPPLNAQRERGL